MGGSICDTFTWPALRAKEINQSLQYWNADKIAIDQIRMNIYFSSQYNLITAWDEILLAYSYGSEGSRYGKPILVDRTHLVISSIS